MLCRAARHGAAATDLMRNDRQLRPAVDELLDDRCAATCASQTSTASASRAGHYLSGIVLTGSKPPEPRQIDGPTLAAWQRSRFAGALGFAAVGFGSGLALADTASGTSTTSSSSANSMSGTSARSPSVATTSRAAALPHAAADPGPRVLNGPAHPEEDFEKAPKPSLATAGIDLHPANAAALIFLLPISP
jgi:hypothetical protein